MSTTRASSSRGQTPITKRRRGGSGRQSEALRAAIVEANYLNQISARPRPIARPSIAGRSDLAKTESEGVTL